MIQACCGKIMKTFFVSEIRLFKNLQISLIFVICISTVNLYASSLTHDECNNADGMWFPTEGCKCQDANTKAWSPEACALSAVAAAPAPAINVDYYNDNDHCFNRKMSGEHQVEGLGVNFNEDTKKCECTLGKSSKKAFVISGKGSSRDGQVVDCSLSNDQIKRIPIVSDKKNEVSCNNTINSVTPAKDADGNDIFKVSFEQSGGGDGDYHNKGTIKDDDGGMVLRSMIYEVFSNPSNKALFESKDYQDAVDLPDGFIQSQKKSTSKMALPAITDKTKLALFKKALVLNQTQNIKNAIFETEPGESAARKQLRQDYLTVESELIKKLASPDCRGLSYYDLKQLGSIQEQILLPHNGEKEISKWSYEVEIDACGSAKSYVLGDIYRSRCNPTLNPLGLPFDSLDITNGKFKDAHASDECLKCTNYITEFKNNNSDNNGTPASSSIQK